ncbi:hypothetical protein RhiJN_26403 [Ceratobasidium sp. AG-Ba]|nr:hypothetical protein RhiJN_26403 [Ceratobasidium sp. AG-Ba]
MSTGPGVRGFLEALQHIPLIATTTITTTVVAIIIISNGMGLKDGQIEIVVTWPWVGSYPILVDDTQIDDEPTVAIDPGEFRILVSGGFKVRDDDDYGLFSIFAFCGVARRLDPSNEDSYQMCWPAPPPQTFATCVMPAGSSSPRQTAVVVQPGLHTNGTHDFLYSIGASYLGQ